MELVNRTLAFIAGAVSTTGKVLAALSLKLERW